MLEVGAERLAQLRPAFTELAAGRDESGLAGPGQVGDGGLERSGAGRREAEDVVLGPEDLRSRSSTRS